MVNTARSQTVVGNLQRKQAVVIDTVWYGAIVVIFWIIDFVGLGTVFTNAASLLVVPFLEQVSRVVLVVEMPYNMIKSSAKSTRRIQDLEMKYSQTLAELGELESLKKENTALRGLLENSDRTLLDSVVTKPIVSYAHPTVAVGKQDGIEEGALVLIGKTIVGVVSEAQERTATVSMLRQSNNSPIVARTESGAEGVIIGDGKRLILTEVARSSEVNVGERVLTVGQPGIPADLFLGQVVSIDTKAADPVKQVVVEQLVDFYQSAVVEVVR